MDTNYRQFEQSNKTLILLRGLPGSGKSSFAQYLISQMSSCIHHEADHYFIDNNGNYKFDANQLRNAHRECELLTEKSMVVFEYQTIVVSNTFTEAWEMEPYFELALKHKYNLTVMTVENYHGNKSVHNVPERTIHHMHERFKVNL